MRTSAGLLWLIGSLGVGICAPLEHAEKAPLASRSLLLDVAAAGERFVAVGERGHVLLSDDRGHHWQQADTVASRALLTGVCFEDERHGIAVGHDQTILVTWDAGRTWTRRHYAPEAQQPLLDVWCGTDKRAIAVGAYASYFVSDDGGWTWSERKFDPQPAPDSDYHLNRIVAASPTRLFIAAEAGHLYRSDDGGVNWVSLPSPYEGSFFGVLPLADEALLAYGLRGRLFQSKDAGKTWQRIDTGAVAMLNDALRLPDGRSVIVGLSGTLLISRRGTEVYDLKQESDRKGVSAALPAGANELLAVGESGVKLIGLPPP